MPQSTHHKLRKSEDFDGRHLTALDKQELAQLGRSRAEKIWKGAEVWNDIRWEDALALIEVINALSNATMGEWDKQIEFRGFQKFELALEKAAEISP